MFRMCECISVCYIKLFVIYVMEEHIDTTEIVGRDIDFLTEKSLTDILFSENFGEFQKKRSRPTARIVDFVYLFFPTVVISARSSLTS